ncbi:MAG: DnaJ domain-containing protein [Flavobacteriales bacterium]|nr:DnaJ domain-containing protein [Flavobacteriales bacterium]
MINYYKILGISKAASSEEIKEAYRKKALRYHPDVNSSPRAHDKFQEINEAYSTLNDPVSKEKYDIVLQYGFDGIAKAIRKQKSPVPKDRAYAPKSAEFMRDYYERKSKPVKKTRQVLMIENILFLSMVGIGVAAFYFAYQDLEGEQWQEKMPGLSGLIFSVSFLILLAMGWKLVLGRKFWL